MSVVRCGKSWMVREDETVATVGRFRMVMGKRKDKECWSRG